MKDLSYINALPRAMQEKILDGPALKPPPGVLPKLVDPPNLNPVGYGVVTTCAILAGTLVLARLYARAFYHKKIEFEDCCAVAALGALAGFFYCSWMTFTKPGLFVHQYNVSIRTMFHALYYMNIGSIIYGNVIMSLKVGILLEWSKTFVPRGFKNTFWWTCHIMIGINVVFYVACTFIEIFGCHPREKLWTPTLPGKCIDMTKVNIASACVNFISDLIILLLPQKIIWGLHMSLSRKIGIAGLFAAGLFASTCAGIRIHSTVTFATSDDIMWNAANMGMWCIAEMTAGFFVLCLPSLRKMFSDSPWVQKMLSLMRSSSNGSKTASSGGPLPPMEVNRMKPRTADDILYSDWDNTDITPLTSISVKSVQTENVVTLMSHRTV